jgi:hypothetical protein
MNIDFTYIKIENFFCYKEIKLKNNFLQYYILK